MAFFPNFEKKRSCFRWNVFLFDNRHPKYLFDGYQGILYRSYHNSEKYLTFDSLEKTFFSPIMLCKDVTFQMEIQHNGRSQDSTSQLTSRCFTQNSINHILYSYHFTFIYFHRYIAWVIFWSTPLSFFIDDLSFFSLWEPDYFVKAGECVYISFIVYI